MTATAYLYLFFAIAHPISELVHKTNLREFLNKVYYKTGKDFFPVSKISGIGGSLLVLAVLITPLFGPDVLWCLVVGLTVADVIQHASHFLARFRKLAPRVHLVTILGVLLLLPWEAVPLPGFLKGGCLGLLLLGALLIFGNWLRNSIRARLKR